MANNEVRNRRPYCQFLLLLALVVWPLSAAFGQQAQPAQGSHRKALSYAFVSPNTRENLTLEEARVGLNSAEETRLITEARAVACRLRQLFSIDRAVGSWSDGAEHSTIIRARTNESSLRYAGSWLGKFSRQRAILYFRQRSAGSGRMYVLRLAIRRPNLAAVSTELEANGVANRTLVPQHHRMLVYIVDLKNELRSKVLTSARRLRARLSSIRGDGEFIGDDDREKAQQTFEQEILKYESAHRRVRRACRSKIVQTSESLLGHNYR